MKSQLWFKYHHDIKVIAVAFLYYLSACLAHFLGFKDSTSLPTWPPSGIAFALIILFGRSIWPGIAIGSLVANLMSGWYNETVSAQSMIIMSTMVAMASTVEALLGNYLIKSWIRTDYPFNTAKHAFRFLFVVLLSCMVGGALSACSLYVSSAIGLQFWNTYFLSWWIGDVTGVLLFTPLILSCVYFAKSRLSKRRLLEVAVFIAFVALFFLALQTEYSNTAVLRALPFLIMPFLLWLAFRVELAFAMAGVVLVALVSVYASVRNFGPFVLSSAEDSIVLLQIFISVISVSTLVVSATVRERLDTQHKLEEFNETLEAKVEERTRALNDEVTIRREAEMKLQRTNEELSKRNTELDNFVYSVSHDLRAPIASVLGLINLAKKDGDLDMKNMYLDMIQKSANQQDHFIREILDQSRNARLEVRREEIFFGPMIEETFDQLKFATPAGQNVQRIINVKQDQPFYGDRWRLKVILNNIISNAIRYRNGHDPVIKVDVAVDGGRAAFEIEDNGRGIAKEHLANVCKMFYRATDDGAGSGLGLYIVKETIDKLNGSIKIDSEIGHGTKVCVHLPEVMN
jgi:signal transduction histidine kinase